MSDRPEMPIAKRWPSKGDYGEGGRVPCPNYGKLWRLRRREAHPTLGPAYELQRFECKSCGTAFTRDVPTPGQKGQK